MTLTKTEIIDKLSDLEQKVEQLESKYARLLAYAEEQSKLVDKHSDLLTKCAQSSGLCGYLMGAFIKGRGEYRYIVWKNDIYILRSNISEKQFGACIVENYPEEYMTELRNSESLPVQLEKMHHEDYVCDCNHDIKSQSTSEDDCECNECLFPYLPNKDGKISKSSYLWLLWRCFCL